MNGHKEEPAKFIQGQGELFSTRKKTKPDDLEEEPKSNVSSKEETEARKSPDNKQSDTFVEMEPRMHPIFKRSYHQCFCGVPGARDVIKEAHSRNFNRCFLKCATKGRGCGFFQWINYKQSSPSSVVRGTFNYKTAE